MTRGRFPGRVIDLLDRVLRRVLRRVPGIGDDDQVRFQPPDEAWRAALANATGPSLNVYLVDVRQNRELRSTERVRTIVGGRVVERLPPMWVDCHYLISAWSQARTEQVEPTVEEHALLHAVLAVLNDVGPVNPSRVLTAGSTELAGWGEHGSLDLPTRLVPADGFGKLAEFWGTMGAGHRWKPVLQLVVGLPVVLTEPVDRGPTTVAVNLAIGPLDRPHQRDEFAVTEP